MNEKQRKKYIEIAQDLCYPNKVIDRLKEANTEAEVEIIMNGARKHD